ncbi:MAG: hypothetical protein M1829_000103 [Trizodia sp. TS-e1964]|nr:MAG: hypothetical protein M1829_000103 [Trizodia sp. TS-e1964]
MDQGSGSGFEEALSPPQNLLERLAQIPGYTWDASIQPLHSSYDDWHVFGLRHRPSQPIPTPEPRAGSSRNSPRTLSRPPLVLQFASSSDIGSELSVSTKSNLESYTPVVARVSTHVLRLEREYHLCKSIVETADPKCVHVVQPVDFVRLSSHADDSGPVVVSIFESPGHNYLRELVNFGPAWYGLATKESIGRHVRSNSEGFSPRQQITLPLFLDFAIGATECLEILHHGQRIIHGELRGDAFHFCQQSGRVKLINFGSGPRSFENGLTSTGWSSLSKELGIKNKLQFIAPEQTGRVPVEPDSRSDIYSLGVLFFTMLTREPAFSGATPMDIVQCVLGRKIPPVSSKRPDVPEFLSAIIQKMTCKRIDERYHSASGLKYDLIQLRKSLDNEHSTALQSTQIASRDVSSLFTLPSNMIGRKEEHDKLVKIIERVSKQHRSAVSRMSLYTISSNSSVSDARLDSFEALNDASSDGQSSHGANFIQSRSNSVTAVDIPSPRAMGLSFNSGNLASHSSPEASPTVGLLSRAGSKRSSRRRGALERHPYPDDKGSKNGSTHSLDSGALPPSAELPPGSRYSALWEYEGGAPAARRMHKFRRSGRCEVAAIAGGAGLGKSCLVQSVQVEARRYGYFATAKFDQAKKTPFGPVLKLLSSLFKQVFSESEVNTEFHQILRSHIRPYWSYLHVMLDLPEFLLGPQPTKSNSVHRYNMSERNSKHDAKPRGSSPSSQASVYSASIANSFATNDFIRAGTAAKSLRFTNIFLEVLRIFADHKFICLCLDDLHFADEESMELISNIVSSKMKILLLVTYRPDECDKEKLRSVIESEHTTKIVLANLNEQAVVEYVASTLHRSADCDYVIPLAAVISEKAEGNPFYMREMLETCYRKQCLFFDYRESCWKFDLDRVFAEFKTENYNDVLNTQFLAKRLQELPEDSRKILAWASLLGHEFSFGLVQELLSGEFDFDDDVETQLKSSCQNGSGEDLSKPATDIILALQAVLQSFIIVQTEEDDSFRFAHDRYIQAARSLHMCHNVPKMHYIICKTLMKQKSHHNTDTEVYDLALHLCKAADIIKRREKDRLQFRELLSDAARRATESGARQTAITYYEKCLELLQDDPWTEGEDRPDVCYEETLQLYTRAAECYHYTGIFDKALEILQTTFMHARTALDKTPSWILQSRQFAHQGNSLGAFTALKNCLFSLGVHVKNMTWEMCDAEFQRLCLKLQGLDRAQLLQDSLNSDETLSHVGTVLVETASAAFWSDSLLFYQIALVEVALHLTRGSYPQVAMGYIHLGAIAVQRFNMIQFAVEMEEFSTELMNQFHDPHTIGRASVVGSLFTRHFSFHVRESIPQLEVALGENITAGDRILTVLNLGALAFAKYAISEDLRDIEAFCSAAHEEVPTWGDDLRGGTMINSVRQASRALQGITYTNSAKGVMSDDHHNSDVYMEKIKSLASHHKQPMGIYLSYKIQILYLYGYLDEAIETGLECLKCNEPLWSVRNTRQSLFYLGLAQIARIRRSFTPNKEKLSEGLAATLDKVKSYRKMITEWQAVSDINYFQWDQLLLAEISELTGDFGDSIQAYENALDHTQLHGFILEEGLACELQGEFFMRRGAKRAASQNLQTAITTYRRFGAFGKATHLANKYKSELQEGPVPRTSDVSCQTDFTTLNLDNSPHEIPNYGRTREWVSPLPNTSEATESALPSLDIIDLSSILASSQLISSELQVDKLIPKMCDVILDSTGGQADFVAIIIDEEDSKGWTVAASGDPENGVTAHNPGLTFSQIDDLVSKQIVLYTLRFREVVFLHNLLEDERFSNVPESYLARNRNGKSVIALPILHGNDTLLGCLYLQGDSFSERNLTVLQLLVNQIGISISNAMMFNRIKMISACNVRMIETQKQALTQAREAEAKAKSAQAEAVREMKLKEEAAKAKSMFLANISHELRTPLNGVIGMSELLKATPMSTLQSEYTDSIRVCADALLTVINDILDLEKLTRNKMELLNVAFNLSETIREVVRALAYTHQNKQLKVTEKLNLPPGLVMGDPVRLHQILMNLLSNSYKFTQTTGFVIVHATTDYENSELVRITISIQDSGIGIAEDEQSKLFQPFSQADSSTARRFGGSGLGLSICKSLIENVMGGKIWLKSRPGVGTTVYFTLTFPKASKEAEAGDSEIVARDPDPMAKFSSSSSPEHPLQISTTPYIDLSRVPRDKLKICIAEDNPINQRIARQFVEKLGFRVEAFNNGQEAVEALRLHASRGNPFHLVLMDVQMPVLDGYEASRRIRRDEDPNVRGVLVIAMTASAIRGDREKCLEAGMNNYLAKPVKASVLKTMIEKYLNQPPASMPNIQQEAKAIAEKVLNSADQENARSPVSAIDTTKPMGKEASVITVKDLATMTNGSVNNISPTLSASSKGDSENNRTPTMTNSPGNISTPSTDSGEGSPSVT